MGDAEGRIVELLTEMRDAQREEMAYRRSALEESLALARRGVRMQRLAMLICLTLAALGLAAVCGGAVLRSGP